MKRIENYAENITDKQNKESRLSTIKLFLEERDSLRILGVRIKSLEGLLIFRTILSLSVLIIFLILGFFIGTNFLLIALSISLIMFFLPSEISKSRIKRISRSILSEIPESLDILSSLIKAGLSLDQAINYYSNNYRGEISQLFKIAQIKIYEGKSRKTAYFGIAKLSFCNEFKTIIKIIIQSDSIGNPINRVLKELSKTIRENQRDQIKIRAERLESSLMLIIFIFMFIPMMLLFLLPVIPQLKMIFN
ncbi:MAG: type II secretion system F family protein [Actinomycetia bacterium]|nr:type II secretion system F family protein [Actinomycetes bacterium]